jgi:hypothetical protein
MRREWDVVAAGSGFRGIDRTSRNRRPRSSYHLPWRLAASQAPVTSNGGGAVVAQTEPSRAVLVRHRVRTRWCQIGLIRNERFSKRARGRSERLSKGDAKASGV